MVRPSNLTKRSELFCQEINLIHKGFVGQGKKKKPEFILDIVHSVNSSLGISFLHVSHEAKAAAAAGISILHDNLDKSRLEKHSTHELPQIGGWHRLK